MNRAGACAIQGRANIEDGRVGVQQWISRTGADARQYAPAAERNAGSILAVLGRHLPSAGTILEIGSGTGQHVIAFAAAHPELSWQPSDPDPAARASIAAWIAAGNLANVRRAARHRRHGQGLDAARSPGRCKAFSASTCCTSRRGRRARAWWRAPRRCSSAARRSTSTGRSSRAAGTPRQATPSSTAICAPAIRPGACVTGRGGRVRRPPRPRSGGRRADAGEQSFGDPAPLLNQAGRRRIGDRGRDGLPTRSGARMLPASTAREGSPR